MNKMFSLKFYIFILFLVYKRSVDFNNDVVFAEFAGHKISEIEIVNIQDTKSYK